MGRAYTLESRKGQGMDAEATHSNLKNLKNAKIPGAAGSAATAVLVQKTEEEKELGGAALDVVGGASRGGGGEPQEAVGAGSGAGASAAVGIMPKQSDVPFHQEVSTRGVMDSRAPHHVYNMWRDSELRYLGYANELGEAFKATVPRAAYFGTYGVACLYVAADARHQGLAAAALHADGKEGTAVTTAVVDTAIWQGLASVAIPGFTINRLVAATTTLMTQPAFQKLPTAARRWAPSIAGLAAIPVIIHPIDLAVDALMDNTFRKFFR